MHRLKAILFDLDGVLVDAVALHFVAFTEAVRLVTSHRMSEEEHQKDYCGLPTRVKIEKLSVPLKIGYEDREKIYRLKQIKTNELARLYIRPNRAHIEMLRELQEHYQLACVSNCIRGSLSNLLNLAEIRQFFSVLISNEDVEHAKPNPEPYLKAVRKLRRVTPHNCIAFEDNDNGYLSAMQAGVLCCRTHYSELSLDLVRDIIERREERL